MDFFSNIILTCRCILTAKENLGLKVLILLSSKIGRLAAYSISDYMELDFIDNVNEFGESVVRLYNFKKLEAIKFKALINETILEKKQKLNLSEVDFIEQRNCNLILGPFKTDEGIMSDDFETFYCALSIESYQNMVKLLEPFCKKETKGYQYLYDLDNPIDFLFSPAGTW